MHSAKTVPQHHLMTLCQYKMFSLYQNTRKREKKIPEFYLGTQGWISLILSIYLLHVVNHLHELLTKVISLLHGLGFAIHTDDRLSV